MCCDFSGKAFLLTRQLSWAQCPPISKVACLRGGWSGALSRIWGGPHRTGLLVLRRWVCNENLAQRPCWPKLEIISPFFLVNKKRGWFSQCQEPHVHNEITKDVYQAIHLFVNTHTLTRLHRRQWYLVPSVPSHLLGKVSLSLENPKKLTTGATCDMLMPRKNGFFFLEPTLAWTA